MTSHPWRPRLAALVALVALSWTGTWALAQTVTFQGQTIDLNTLTPEQREMAMKHLPPGAVVSGGPVQPATAQPATDGAPKPDEKKDEGEKSGAEGVATVKRSDSDGAADPKELKAKPDKDGMVQFSFNNQPWADVLEWYKDVSDSSLDWQELPAEKLNLVTKRRYTLDQTRNLLNRYLIARGFTMLKQGRDLSVMKLAKIDPALVPRVEPDDLEDHMPYDFARVRFDLPDAMDPAKAVEDVKVLLMPTAKVTPLLASKQLMVIDTVSNLRDVRDLLYGEQMAEGEDIRPELFPIRYRRADYIAEQIMIVLGLDPSSRKIPMEMQIEQQRMQLLMQMQGSGKDVTNLLKQDGPPVFLAVDKRRNTVSVNAPPKEMAIIKRVVEQFDVPGVGVATAVNEELTLKRYQTASISPDAIVTALKEIANLSPLTQLQSDTTSKTIFATATAADHDTIQGMIDKLDGTGRELHVIWLSRRSLADQIAGTIQALMVGEKKKEERRNPWDWYGGYGQQEEELPDTGFRVQADIENNRLILMATVDEFAEVNRMLAELGVVTSDRGGNPATWRVLDARTPEETKELLERLQEAWGDRSPLNINVAPPAEAPAAEEAPTPAADPVEDPDDAAPAEDEDTLTAIPGSVPRLDVRRRVFWLAQFTEEASDAPAAAAEPGDEDDDPGEPGDPDTPNDPEEPDDAEDPAEDDDAETAKSLPAKGAPINLTVTPDGRIVISSSDAVALDQFEDLLSELSPPQQDFKAYYLKHADCYFVHDNLCDYYTDELADDGGDDYSWFWGGGEQEDEPATLGKRRKLRFIYDDATNSVLVQNASPSQIQTIDKLIKIYDQPPPEDSVRQRRTEIVKIQYSRAQDVATALKEVYRDLLSSKDKEFQNRDGNQRGGGRQVTYNFPGSGNNKSAPVKVGFEGALSIGVDTISNTLIISAEELIVEDVKGIITQLDNEARPDTIVQVHRVTGSLDAEELQEALSTSLSRPWPGGKPEAAGGQNNQGGDRDRGEGRRGRGDRGGRDRDN